MPLLPCANASCNKAMSSCRFEEKGWKEEEKEDDDDLVLVGAAASRVGNGGGGGDGSSSWACARAKDFSMRRLKAGIKSSFA